MGSQRLILPVVTAFALVIAAVGCERQELSQGAASGLSLRGQAAGCNLLLITLDTTRADRLGCYGWEDAHTPHLDALAESGTRFEQAYSHVPITLPSHANLLTGTRPPENGVRGHGYYALGTELPTLAEYFRRADYRTGAFVSATVLDSRYGLDRGFETYDDEMVRTSTGEWRSQRPADVVCDRALAWLRQVGHEQFMCWVHFFDPHTPYEAPPSYVSKTSHPYDAEVAFADANVGRLVDWLRADSLLAKTLIVVVADHGESLGEHGYEWHSLLVYEAEMRVPLVFSLPGRLPAGRTAPGLAAVSDVMPTVLELMGWPIPAAVAGRSLAPVLDGQAPVDRKVYGETDYPYESFGWSKLRSLIDARWKYIRAPAIELYDRSTDRGDLHNVADAHPEVAARMERELAAMEGDMSQRAGGSVDLDAKTAAALRSLGYIGGAGPSAADSAGLKNPRDMVQIVHDFRKAEFLLATEQVEEAVALVEPAVKLSPESFVLVELLGRAYGTAGYLEPGQRLLTRAVELNPRSANTYQLLARVLGMRERFGPCIQACQKALELDPDNNAAAKTLSLAQGYLLQRRREIEQCRADLEAQPQSVKLCLRLNHLLDTMGQDQERYAVLGRGLEHHPDSASLADAMARLLATSWEAQLRNGGEAVRLARLACEASNEQNPDHLATLAAAYAEAGRFEEALRTARRARDLYAQVGDQRSAGILRLQIEIFEADQPYRALP